MGKPIKGLYRFIYTILRPPAAFWLNMHVEGTENLPRDGGFIIAPNHISMVDPFCIAFAMLDANYPLRFMAKKELFGVPIFKRILTQLDMVPVDRHSATPGAALGPTRDALRAGEAVCVYVEGTLTRDPQYWPMRAKTGAARLALDENIPIIPVAQWGPQAVLPRYSWFFDLRPHRDIHVVFQPALDLSDLRNEKGSEDHEAVEEASKRLQKAITRGVEVLRGEKAPETPWNVDQMHGPKKSTLKRFASWRKHSGGRGRGNAAEVSAPQAASINRRKR